LGGLRKSTGIKYYLIYEGKLLVLILREKYPAPSNEHPVPITHSLEPITQNHTLIPYNRQVFSQITADRFAGSSHLFLIFQVFRRPNSPTESVGRLIRLCPLADCRLPQNAYITWQKLEVRIQIEWILSFLCFELSAFSHELYQAASIRNCL